MKIRMVYNPEIEHFELYTGTWQLFQDQAFEPLPLPSTRNDKLIKMIIDWISALEIGILVSVDYEMNVPCRT